MKLILIISFPLPQVKYFQLGHTEIPADVERRHLQAHLETEQIEKVKYEQETIVVEKATQERVGHYLIDQMKNCCNLHHYHITKIQHITFNSI